MVLPWFYHGSTMVLPWFYHGFTMVLQWFYYRFTIVLAWVCHGSTMVLPTFTSFGDVARRSQIFPIPLQVHWSELHLGTAVRGAGPDPCGAAKGGGGEGGERLSIGIPGADAAAGQRWTAAWVRHVVFFRRWPKNLSYVSANHSNN